MKMLMNLNFYFLFHILKEDTNAFNERKTFLIKYCI